MKTHRSTQNTTAGVAAMAAAAGFAALAAAPETADAAETLGEALKESSLMVNWRFRYEGVDQVGFSEQADALTSRVRVGFQTGDWGKTNLLGEAVWTEDITDGFNSTTNGQTEYPIVADPGGFAAVNRFALTNRSLEHTTLTLGRQRIVLDDSRFVGNVGWRQNEQTYDGLRAQLDVGKDNGVAVDLAYIDQVNRVFGPDSPIGRWHGDIFLANVSKSFGWGKLTGFAYGLDIDEAAALSTDTLGLRLNGSKPLGSMTALYTVSVAEQRDAADNPADLSEAYLMLEAGLRIDKVTVSLGLEQLGSDGTNAVTTPLATLHAFQGWADKFLATPPAGIDDSYLSLAYRAGNIGPFENLNIVGVYHEINADVGSSHYGDELDVSVVASLRRMTFTLKYASYNADQLFTDTDKFWLSMDYAF